MERAKRDYLKKALMIGCIVAIGYYLRYLAYITDGIISMALSDVRTFLYVSLFAYWGILIVRRIVHPSARRLFMGIISLTIFWMIVRTLKYTIFYEPSDIKRWFWYLYYIPLLLIPTVSLLISLMEGKGITYNLPKWQQYGLLAAAIAIVCFVLTNDLHQQIWSFPPGVIWEDNNATYRWGYYVALIWEVGCACVALLIIIKRSRLQKIKRLVWMPFVPIIVLVFYTYFYVRGYIKGDVTVVVCLTVYSIFEGCISLGLLHVNTLYEKLFHQSQGLSTQIFDRHFQVKYRSQDAQAIDESLLRTVLKEKVVLNQTQLLRSHPITAGYSCWTEDIGPLYQLNDELEMIREQLQDRHAMLALQVQKEEQRHILQEQNRLYDLLENKTYQQIDEIAALTEQLQDKQLEPNVAKEMLIRIVLLGTYIKRRKNMLLSADQTAYLSTKELESSLRESLQTLNLLNIRYGLFVNTDHDVHPQQIVSLAYECFECVMESVLDSLQYMMVSVTTIDGKLRLNMRIQSQPCYEKVKLLYPNITIEEEEENEWYLSLPLSFPGEAV